MRALALAVLILAVATAAQAAEPSGCDKFKWPIERERAALTAPDRSQVNSGAEMASVPAKAMTLALRPGGEVKLPSEPERAPKEGTYSGFISIKDAVQAGSYTVSLSGGAWVDLVQDGRMLKPTAFSGATDCDGIRKTMKFDLAAKPFVLQISGLKDASLSVFIQPSQ